MIDFVLASYKEAILNKEKEIKKIESSLEESKLVLIKIKKNLVEAQENFNIKSKEKQQSNLNLLLCDSSTQAVLSLESNKVKLDNCKDWPGDRIVFEVSYEELKFCAGILGIQIQITGYNNQKTNPTIMLEFIKN